MKNRPEQTIAYRVYYGGTDMLGIASVETLGGLPPHFEDGSLIEVKTGGAISAD